MNQVEKKAQDYAERNPYGGSLYGFLYGYLDCRIDVAGVIARHPDIPEEKKEGIVKMILSLNQGDHASS